MRKSSDNPKPEELAEKIIEEFDSTKNNEDLIVDILTRGFN